MTPGDLDDDLARVRAALEREGAARVPHANRRSLLDHLAGTAAIVRAWDAPRAVVLAALGHSLYGTDAFATALLDPSRDGERLRSLLGEDAERLARLFGAMDRRAFVDAVEAAPPSPVCTAFGATRDVAEPAALRLRDGTDAPLAAGEHRALATLVAANRAEQAHAPDGSPAPWLAAVDAFARRLPARGIAPPLDARTPIAAGAETRAIAAYARALAAFGRADRTADRALREAAALLPPVGEPHAWLALLALAACRPREALAHARDARTRMLALGVPWDARLTQDAWLAVVAAIERAAAGGAPPLALSGDASALFESARAAAAREATAASRARFDAYVDVLASDAPYGRAMRYPGLAATPWPEPARFPIVADLEAACDAIASEVAALGGRAFHRESEPIARDGDWDVATLWERGLRRDDVCAMLPTVARIVESHATVRTLAGLVYVSRLRPGTRIAPHRGPTNLRVRCHLPIAVPAGDCGLRVAGETRRWERGRCLVFDDSLEHDAWNLAEADRIVLIVDVWHPGLAAHEVELVRNLQNRMVQQARDLQRYWADNERERGWA